MNFNEYETYEFYSRLEAARSVGLFSSIYLGDFWGSIMTNKPKVSLSLMLKLALLLPIALAACGGETVEYLKATDPSNMVMPPPIVERGHHAD